MSRARYRGRASLDEAVHFGPRPTLPIKQGFAVTRVESVCEEISSIVSFEALEARTEKRRCHHHLSLRY
tara:strand:+ start:396 stop:602 length:207 start_codon:yes stop_codon:yes gene_type:complete